MVEGLRFRASLLAFQVFVNLTHSSTDSQTQSAVSEEESHLYRARLTAQTLTLEI